MAQFRALPHFLHKRQRVAALLCLVFGFLSFSFLVGSFLSHHIELQPSSGGVHTEGVLGSPHTINPLYALPGSADADVAAVIFSSLVKISPKNGEVVPDLADQIAVSDDGLHYTFSLTQKAFWHDGTPVTASDVAFTYRALQNPLYRSPFTSTYSGFTIEATDDTTVVFHLDKPNLYFLQLLTVGILPEHLWQSIEPNNAPYAALNTTPVGSGPFLFRRIVKSSNGNIFSITLDANEQYYRQEAFLRRLIFKFFSTPKELEQAARSHAVDATIDLPFSLATSLQDDPGMRLLTAASSRFVVAFFETDTLPFSQKNVRLAFSGVISPQYVNNIPPSHWSLQATDTLPQLSDEEAQKLLTEAGYSRNENGQLVDQSGKILTLSLVTIDDPRMQTAAQDIKIAWERLGASITLSTVDKTALQNDIIPKRSFSVVLLAINPNPQDGYGTFWSSGSKSPSGMNISHFALSTMDDIAKSLDGTLTAEARAEQTAAMIRVMQEQAPAVFLPRLPFLYITRSTLQGIDVSFISSPSDRFCNITSWYRKTRWRFAH